VGEPFEHTPCHPAGRQHCGQGDHDDQRRGTPPPRSRGCRGQERRSVEGSEEGNQQRGHGGRAQQYCQCRTEIRHGGRIDGGYGESGAFGVADEAVVVDQAAADGDRGGGCTGESQIQITEESPMKRCPYRERAGDVDFLPPHRAGNGVVIELPVAEGDGAVVGHPEAVGEALADHIVVAGRDDDAATAWRIDGISGLGGATRGLPRPSKTRISSTASRRPLTVECHNHHRIYANHRF